MTPRTVTMTESEYLEATREARAVFDARYDAAMKAKDYAQISLAQLDYEAFCAPLRARTTFERY